MKKEEVLDKDSSKAVGEKEEGEEGTVRKPEALCPKKNLQEMFLYICDSSGIEQYLWVDM